MPLVALLDGQRVLADTLAPADRGRGFICPACRVPFYVVLPKRKIRHFRHATKEEHWEPESEDHLEMKQGIYSLSLKLGFNAALEQIIKGEGGKAIADVFIETEGHRIAIECQCSPVPYDDFERRDAFYRLEGIIPIWILGGAFFRHTQASMTKMRFEYDELRDEYYPIEYTIQKIGYLERELLDQWRLFFFNYGLGGPEFYEGYFKYRWRGGVKHHKEDPAYCESLGWFRNRETNLKAIIEEVRT
jgi:competence CoiA-like predicted nuclease